MHSNLRQPLPAWADPVRVDRAWRAVERRWVGGGFVAATVLAALGLVASANVQPADRHVQLALVHAPARAVATPRTGLAAAAPATPAASARPHPTATGSHPLGTPRPTAPATAPAVAPPPASAPPRLRTFERAPTKPLPYGKGMWIYQPDHTEGGDVHAIVARARAAGLSHLYVRTGSSWDGFNTAGFVAQLLPVAHAAHLQVYGWDFPRFIRWEDDINRALAAINLRVGNDRLDGFAVDIETPSEGTFWSKAAVEAYTSSLRKWVGPSYTLISVVPRPSEMTALRFPWVEATQHMDAIAPMVYWLNRQPDSDVDGALKSLAHLGKPLFPVGQTFDGGPEGGRPGVPPPDELLRFMATAAGDGAQGVSFWSWQGADQPAWDTIRDAPQFRTRGARLK